MHETRKEAMGRIKRKPKKIFEDYIKFLDLKTSQDGIEVELKAILYKYGITQKFGGGYEGNACQMIMENDELQSEILALKNSELFKKIMDRNAVIFTSDIENKQLLTVSENYAVDFRNFETLVKVFREKCMNWGKNLIIKVPHLRFNNYMHLVIYHAPQILDRDKSINIHSSSGIERSYERMKMGIRRHLGLGPWGKTLLTRWVDENR